MARAKTFGNFTSNENELKNLVIESMAKSKRRALRADASDGSVSIISFSEIALALRPEMVESLKGNKKKSIQR